MEPIAVIGASCRFPGAQDLEAFWDLLRKGVSAIDEIPPDRWNSRELFDPKQTAPGKMSTRWGGFLENIDLFDHAFFGISENEATTMDPQQRLLMETAWEALEDAGQTVDHLAQITTGVFVGLGPGDYGRMALKNLDLIDAYTNTGNFLSIAANRISYAFDFRGPSVAIDTACSSSLVAVHYACQSLSNHECDMALAGGVNVILSPEITVGLSRTGALSPDGHCRVFDAEANGYVRSEGVGILVLKPLHKAISDADPIYAVVRGSAVNHGGRTNGLTAPSSLAQEKVFRAACHQARVSPDQVQYVEAHGSATLIGDLIEAKALGAVYGTGRTPGNYCLIGSVKSNIGHPETAAGVAALIKVALALKHRIIPPSLHFKVPNPHIRFEDYRLKVQTTLTSWPGTQDPALAAVSSFGLGGTNSHMIIEEFQRADEKARSFDERRPAESHLLPVSARSQQALCALAQSYLCRLTAEAPEMDSLSDLCYTASMRRNHHDYRFSFVFHSKEELVATLRAFIHGETSRAATNSVPPIRRRKLVFVLPGGALALQQLSGFVAREPILRSALHEFDELLTPNGNHVLLTDPGVDAPVSALSSSDMSSLALFALQVALAKVWASLGIVPDAVLASGTGEIAALHVAGTLGVRDAMRLVVHQAGIESMTANKDAARDGLLGEHDRQRGKDSVGCVSAVPSPLFGLSKVPNSFAACHRVVAEDRRGHSDSGTIPIFAVNDRPGKDQKLLAPDPSDSGNGAGALLNAVAELASAGYDTFVELSAHPCLQVLSGGPIGFDSTVALLPSLARHRAQRTVLLESLGALYARGWNVDWRALFPDDGRCVRLPSYPWQRVRCWLTVAEKNMPSPAAADVGPRDPQP